jgi:hypothetical protein
LSPLAALLPAFPWAVFRTAFTHLRPLALFKLSVATALLNTSSSQEAVARVVVVEVLVVIEAQSQVKCPVVGHQPKAQSSYFPEAIQLLLVPVVLATTLVASVVARLLVEVALYRQ